MDISVRALPPSLFFNYFQLFRVHCGLSLAKSERMGCAQLRPPIGTNEAVSVIIINLFAFCD